MKAMSIDKPCFIKIICFYDFLAAVHGDWTNWSQWTDCSHDCFGGTRSRERNCSDPQPNYGGDSCEGKKEETENCNMHPCPGNIRYYYILIENRKGFCDLIS